MSDEQSRAHQRRNRTLAPRRPPPPCPRRRPPRPAAEVEAHLAPDQEETRRSPTAQVDAVKMDAPKVEPPKARSRSLKPKPKSRLQDRRREAGSPRFPGNVTIMAPGDRVGADAKAGPADGSSASAGSGRWPPWWRSRRCGGAGRRAGNCRRRKADGRSFRRRPRPRFANDSALEASVARIDAEIVALKASLEHNSKTTPASSTRPTTASTSSRRRRPNLPRNSPSSARPSTSFAPLRHPRRRPPPRRHPQRRSPARYRSSRLRPLPAPALLLRPSRKSAGCRRVEGWVLRDVANGSALIEGRRGIYEVYAGDPIPGLGRVDAIRSQDGRWVVVTSKGLIVAR